MTYLDSIIEDVKAFLTTDIRFKFQSYAVRKEIGTDKEPQGVNFYELTYSFDDGQSGERIKVAVVYYEKESEVKDHVHNVWNIKERAKIFYNFICKRFAHGWGQSPSTKKFVSFIEAGYEMEFLEDDSKNIVGYFELDILRRNDYDFNIV